MKKQILCISFLAFFSPLAAEDKSSEVWLKAIAMAIENSDIASLERLTARSPNRDNHDYQKAYNIASKVLEERKKILKVSVDPKVLKKYAYTIEWVNKWCDRLIQKTLPLLEVPQDDTEKLIQLISTAEHPDWSVSRVCLVTGVYTTTLMTHNCKRLTNNLFDKIESIENAQQMVKMLEDRADYSTSNLAITSK